MKRETNFFILFFIIIVILSGLAIMISHVQPNEESTSESTDLRKGFNIY